ncbi:right-handed parallel beta-helix repeat-containing protein [Neorhodopirellula lusitana]|uniref:right-handed parallel beta-helix repeat-containing protein n=1 Tax=Neorhodopirellula lusitana TaxID=445327 RepID=UPI00384A8060
MRPIIFLLFVACSFATRAQAGDPVVLGQGEDAFKVGQLLAHDDFENLDNWVVQIQQRSGFPPARVAAREQSLDCLLPGRGCTVWFKQKLPTRVAITYDVLCPTPKPAIKGVQPRDINNLWMATDPVDPEQGLFDSSRYTGKFSSYDKIHAYYASTGGGGAVANRTTRMRRYPREVDGKPVEHLALTDKDDHAGYMVIPDRVMSVQLVAYDDVIQYIVDGKLVYEIASGSPIRVEARDSEGKPLVQETEYDLERFPVYTDGYFGFRLVGTHHIYTNFRVHALVADETVLKEQEGNAVEVDSVEMLRQVMKQSDQVVVMKPGTYVVSDLLDSTTAFDFSGSHNSLDLTGVTLQMPLSTLRKMSVPEQRSRGRDRGSRQRGLRSDGDRSREFSRDGERGRDRRRRGVDRSFKAYKISGSQITIKGGTFENVYPGGMTKVTNFGNYNQKPEYHPIASMTEVSVTGDDVQLIDCRFTIRGSYPYGYGNMYGIGAGSVVGLKKHSGIQITGDRVLLERCQVKMESFGHAIFIQGGEDTTVRDTLVEGEVRPSDDLYHETNEGDLAREFNYQLQWPDEVKGLPIPKQHMINLTEDGIRAYDKTGHVTVENCTVRKTRGGIKLYMAKSASVSNCEVTDCVIQGYSIPSRGVIANCRGNAAYGPLLYVHSNSHSSQQIDIEVLPSPHGIGDHPLAAINGQSHSIHFTSSGDAGDETLRPIVVGYPLRFDYLSVDYPDVPDGHEAHFDRFAPRSYRAENINLRNETAHPVVLGSLSQGNTITSAGPVRDLGSNVSTVLRRD